MKQKIVFMLIDMNVGGTEKALLNMIATLPREKYEVTILLLLKRGGFLESIPDDVEVLTFDRLSEIVPKLNDVPKKKIIELASNKKIWEAARLLFLNVILKITKDRRIYFKSLLKNFSELKKEYDIAVAYAGPMDFISYFVIKKIKAKIKIQWIQFDIAKVGFDERFVNRIYKAFDEIFVVSREGKVKFERTLPRLKGKVDVYPNVISRDTIQEQANQGTGFTDDFNGIRILTVGRLSIEKGQDFCIKVLEKLVKNGYDVKWYCVGEGEARGRYEKLIKDNDLEERFILLGADTNPYPYMAQCDIYAQTSRHEGYCITLAEAKLLKKPIVTTDFTGAREQVKNGETGMIVNINENAIYNEVKRMLDNENLRQMLIYNLEKEGMNTTKKKTFIKGVS